jgi:Xaa-Pro aminopeptidase
MNFKQYLDALTSRPIPKDLAFPEEEYRRRVAKVRSLMAERGLDALLVTEVPNVCYLSGYDTFVPNNFACLTLAADGEPTLQVAEFEIPGALLNSWVKDVRATRFNDPDAVVKEFSGILQEHKLDGKRIGLETRLPGINIDVYEGLKKALPRANFVDASDLVFRARLVKSPAELAYMRQAAEIAKKGIADAAKSVRAGMSDNEIASVAYATLAKEGSEYFSCQPCVVVGHRTGWIHTSQRRSRVKAGETVMMEVGAFVRRYVGAIMHTVVVGQPSRDVERLVKASDDTLKLIAATVKPGRTAHEVATEVKKGLDGVAKEAYSTGMFGYAVGLSFPPTWREGRFMIAEGVHEPMVPNMTFLSPITLRLPGILGIGYTETLAVTETGCEVLTAHDRTLTVAPA